MFFQHFVSVYQNLSRVLSCRNTRFRPSSSLNNIPLCPAHIPFRVITILSQNQNVPSSTIFNALQLLYYVLLYKHVITIIPSHKQNTLPRRYHTNITFSDHFHYSYIHYYILLYHSNYLPSSRTVSQWTYHLLSSTMCYHANYVLFFIIVIAQHKHTILYNFYCSFVITFYILLKLFATITFHRRFTTEMLVFVYILCHCDYSSK